MRSIVKYSVFSTVLTALTLVALFFGCIFTVHDKWKFITLLAVYLLLFCFILFCGPWYIKADTEYIVLGSLLRKKKLPMRDVESVELFQPTMGARRIFGSGGFMGYWGLFSEGDIGRYHAFHGKASDCFLIRMKNGSKYVLGCENPAAMVDYIKKYLS